MKRAMAQLGGLLLSVCSSAYAHHSVAAQYDTSKSISITGDVRELQLASPHSYIIVEVAHAGAQMTSWRAELTSAAFLHRAGWTARSLSVGEHVQLTGSPSRTNALELYVTAITKADGSHLALLPLDGPQLPASER